MKTAEDYIKAVQESDTFIFDFMEWQTDQGMELDAVVAAHKALKDDGQAALLIIATSIMALLQAIKCEDDHHCAKAIMVIQSELNGIRDRAKQ